MRGLLRSKLYLVVYLAVTSIATGIAVKNPGGVLPGEFAGRKLEQPFCSEGVFEKPFEKPHWNGWGAGLTNARSQPEAMASLPREKTERLKLKWAFGVPGVTGMSGQPTVVGGRLFFGTEHGKVYSLDAESGCTRWTFDASGGVRTAITIGPISDHWAAYFGDNRAGAAHVYALDASTGKPIWKTVVESSAFANVTGAPVLASGKLYIPITASEDANAGKATFECCRFQGSLVALDASTGQQLWKTYTISEPPHATYKSSVGTQQWGPSGAGIWSAPTVDLQKRAIYVTTGDAHSTPAVPTSDSILAFNMDSGALLWSRQILAGDVWNAACVIGDAANCPKDHGDDLDFGSSPILLERARGKRALIAGQKSGMIYALDPDQRGKTIWQKRIGKGGFNGGVQWGMAADDKNVYAALSDTQNVFESNATAPGAGFLEIKLFEFQSFLIRAKRRYLTDDGGGTFALSLEFGE